MIHTNRANRFIFTTVASFVVATIAILIAKPVAASPLLGQTNSDFNNCCANQSYSNQGYQGNRGWGYRHQYNRMYDRNTVTTVSGEVISVDTFIPMVGMSNGIHLQLKTDEGLVDVHLGPSWYLDNQELQIEPQDKIEVTGSRVSFGNRAVIVAAEVKKGDANLVLRDRDGFPAWSGWRRSQPQF